jgi:hypothetical protein
MVQNITKGREGTLNIFKKSLAIGHRDYFG